MKWPSIPTKLDCSSREIRSFICEVDEVVDELIRPRVFDRLPQRQSQLVEFVGQSSVMCSQGLEHLPDWLEGRLREDVVGIFGLVDEDRNHDGAPPSADLSAALRITRPTAWMMSTIDRLGSMNATPSSTGTSTPSPRQAQLERMPRVSSGRLPNPFSPPKADGSLAGGRVTGDVFRPKFSRGPGRPRQVGDHSRQRISPCGIDEPCGLRHRRVERDELPQVVFLHRLGQADLCGQRPGVGCETLRCARVS